MIDKQVYKKSLTPEQKDESHIDVNHSSDLHEPLISNKQAKLLNDRVIEQLSKSEVQKSAFQRKDLLFENKHTQNKIILSRFGWIINIWNISDVEVKHVCGIDAALYLIYLKYSSIFFLFIAICSNMILLPLFVTSSTPTDKKSKIQTITTLERLTLINAQDRQELIWIVFLCTVLYSVMGHVFIYYFDYARKSLNISNEQKEQELSEQQIAMNTLLLRGLNKEISQREAQFKLNQIFRELLERDLISVHVVSDMNNIIQLIKKQEYHQQQKEYYQELYTQEGLIPRKKEGVLCCYQQTTPLKDYYAQKLLYTKQQLAQTRQNFGKYNTGVAFISLTKATLVTKLVRELGLIKREIKTANQFVYNKYHVQDWNFEFAPCPSDIYWEKLNKKTSLRLFKTIMINFMIFFLTVVLISPLSILNSMEPLVMYFQKQQTEGSFLSTLIVYSLTPLILFVFNQVFIPTLVDMTSYYEEIESKSQRHRSNLFKQLVFILINTVFIPITQTTTIEGFLVHVAKEDLTDFQLELSRKFLRTSEFFLRYIIQCTFITNIFQLLDAPHQIYLSCRRLFKQRKHKIPKSQQQSHKDNWYFDVGYHLAFSVSVFVIVMIFSASVPLIPLFGFLYFAIRYIVDKYNFMYVYQTEFQSNGVLGRAIIRYTIFALILFQVIMCGLFTSIFGQDFLISSIILIIGELLFIVSYKLLSIRELREAFAEVLNSDNYKFTKKSKQNNENINEDSSDSDDSVEQANTKRKLMRIMSLKRKVHDKEITSMIHRQIIKDAYLHPNEIAWRNETAIRLLNTSIKEVIEKAKLKQQRDKERRNSKTNNTRNQRKSNNGLMIFEDDDIQIKQKIKDSQGYIAVEY
eukprot:403357711